MNILFVVFHFPPISGGGVIVAVDIANSLAKIGHEVSVLTPNLEWNGPKYEPEVDSKIDIIRVNVPSKNNLKVAARRCKSPLIEKGIELGRNKKFDFIFTIFHPFHMAPNAAVSIGDHQACRYGPTPECQQPTNPTGTAGCTCQHQRP